MLNRYCRVDLVTLLMINTVQCTPLQHVETFYALQPLFAKLQADSGPEGQLFSEQWIPQ